MKKLLVGFLILVFSVSAYAAEPIIHDGKEGVFFTTQEAQKILQQVEVEIPRLKKENELLQAENRVQKELQNILNEKAKAEEEISNKWQESYKLSLEELSKYKSRDDIRFYIYAGLFIAGTITGGGIMYGSSMLVKNIK